MATAPRRSVATSTASPKAKRADWDAIERDYRTAKFTLRELASKHGVSHQAIAKRSKVNAWTQDLSIAIRQATNAKLVDELVAKEVASGGQEVANVVLIAAEVNTQVILGHRQGLREITEVKNQLLNQIRQAAANMGDLADIIEMVRKPDDNGQDKANDALRKAMGRSALVDDLKKMADVDEKVRKGEREAFGIESMADTPDAAKPKRITLEFVDVEPRFE